MGATTFSSRKLVLKTLSATWLAGFTLASAWAQPAPPECALPPGPGAVCPGMVPAISAGQAAAMVSRAVRSVASNTMSVAVVDRAGRVLALYQQPGAVNKERDADEAIGLARTAAFFANNHAPLSSRTVRFVSGIHYPPGIARTQAAALYGIENTNRGCSFNLVYNEGKCVPEPKSFRNMGLNPCDAFVKTGCGNGITTGKVQPFDAPGAIDPEEGEEQPVNPGGVPEYNLLLPDANGNPPTDQTPLDVDLEELADRYDVTLPAGLPKRVFIGVGGGIGVAGIPPDLAEYAAFRGSVFGFLQDLFGEDFMPEVLLPTPQNVYIDGIRLPFVKRENQTRPEDVAAGAPPVAANFLLAPRDGGCIQDGYLAGPIAGSRMSLAEVEEVVNRSIEVANRTRAIIRLPLNTRVAMVISVADLDGKILALYRMPDSTIFSIDVAVTKARNVVYFGGSEATVRNDLPGLPPGTAVTNRTISFASQPLYPSGIDRTDPGPWFETLYLRDLANPCSQGSQPANANQSGIVFFPGSTALYRDGAMIGGLGISGDGVEQDDWVTTRGAGRFFPPQSIRADQVFIRGVRLPFIKYPRSPECKKICKP